MLNDRCSNEASSGETPGVTGAQALCQALTDQGVEIVFGYPGGAILPTYDALLEYPIRHVLVRHEQGAAHMADGYARATGRVGVAIATSGPGATNLVTGIATAMLDSVPMVCITGQVPSSLLGRDAFQEVDVTGITLPITKHNYLVTRPEEVRDVVREAFEVARSGRPGPVLIDITKDAQQGFVEFDEELTRPQKARRFSVSAQDLERMVELVNWSQRPVILAGRGIVQSTAEPLLRELAERLQIPVASTLLGLGAFPASHPLHLGMMGMHGESWVNSAIQEADLLIALGMRFDDRVTGKLATYAPRARKIHVDIDAAELNKNVTVDVGIVGDLREVLSELLPRLGSVEQRDWTGHISELRGASAVRDIQRLPDTGRLYAAHVIHDLWRLTAGDALLVTDVGQHQMWAAQYYHHEKPAKLITSGGLGTMGFALPAAIGASMARPEEETWVIVGDGGFQMTAAELTTCVQESVKIHIAVINNGYLGMVRQWQEFFYGRRYAATPMLTPDFVKLAEAHGIEATRVESRSQIEGAVTEARQSRGSFLIDFRVEKEDSVYPMVPAGADLHNMIRRPADG